MDKAYVVFRGVEKQAGHNQFHPKPRVAAVA